MNIMFLVAENDTTSGAFNSMAKLVEILYKQHHQHIVVILPNNGNGRGLLDKYGIESYIIRSCSWVVDIQNRNSLKEKTKHIIKRIINFFAEIRIMAVIKKKKIDLIHINTSWVCVGANAAQKLHIPLVWHIREFLEEDQGLQIYNKEKGYALMRKASSIIAISTSIYKKYETILEKEKISIILNGIDAERFYSSNHVILNRKIIKFLIIGYIRKQKGQIEAIKACIKLHETGYQNIFLSIVGHGEEEYEKELRHFVCEHNASDYIKFCGDTDSPEKYYQEADVTFMCSESEAFGRVTVEAMLSGSLVIGKDCAATKEIIQHKKTGLLYRKMDEDDLVLQIRYAIDYPDVIRRIAKQGQLYALSNLTAQKNAEEINNLYQSLVHV